MSLKKVTWFGLGSLRALGISKGRSRIVEEKLISNAVMTAYGRHMVVQEARTGIVTHIGDSVEKNELLRLMPRGVVRHQLAKEEEQVTVPEPEVKEVPELFKTVEVPDLVFTEPEPAPEPEPEPEPEPVETVDDGPVWADTKVLLLALTRKQLKSLATLYNVDPSGRAKLTIVERFESQFPDIDVSLVDKE
jgi:hypothetical protein